MYLYVCLFVCMLGFCSSFFLYVFFFKRWIYVCSSGMSNVHTGIENTSQGGVSSVLGAGPAGGLHGAHGVNGGGRLMSGGLLNR